MHNGAPPRLVLVVTVGGVSTTVPLPASGRLVVGRSAECDVCLDDRMASRRHAILHLGRAVEVEDLGSQNGSRLEAPRRAPPGVEVTLEAAQQRLEPGRRMPFGPGDSLWIGATLLTVREREAAPRGRVVEDPRMRALYDLAERVASAPINVLILGETGTGKEVLAEALHAASARASAPLVRLNCAALPEALVESELFGHARGAFTGADRARRGLLEAAEGGTVFLDEVGELPLAVQAKLLRVIEERRVTPIGATESRALDVRFVAATHQDLRARIERGTFREDLYFRLDGFTLHIPPLRERPLEIVPFAERFLVLAAGRAGRSAPALSAVAQQVLCAHRWPGNVRELRNVMERALVLCGGATVEAEHLHLDPVSVPPVVARGGPLTAHPRGVPPGAATPEGDGALSAELEDVERRRIEEALAECSGNQTRAARMLGISRRTLVYRLDKYGMPRPRRREPRA